MTAALYPREMSAHGPCRSLTDVARDLTARRLGLLVRQMNARAEHNWPEVERCGVEIAAVTRRLQIIEEAGT